MTLAQELQSFVRFYFVYGLSDFMQLVDSALTVHMQCTGFITGTLCIVFSILCMDSWILCS